VAAATAEAAWHLQLQLLHGFYLHDVLQLLQLLLSGVAAVLDGQAAQAGQLLLLQDCSNGRPCAGGTAGDMHLLQVAASAGQQAP
jgi:hypothetical protein